MQHKNLILTSFVLIFIFFGVTKNALAKQYEVTLSGFIYNEDGSVFYDNFPVIIYPNALDTVSKYTVYTNSNGFYFYTFVTDLDNPSLIKIRSFCEQDWINNVDTVELTQGIVNRNYYICHNPLWYIQKMVVCGRVTKKDNGQPVSEHKVILNSSQYSDFSHKFITNSEGYYSDTVQYSILDTSKYAISTYSLCDRTFDILTQVFYPSTQTFNFDFEVCLDSLNSWDIAFFYKTYPYSNQIYFQQISNYEVDSVHWDFGDNSVGKGKEVVHDFEHGSYKIVMTSFFNGEIKKFTKRIIIGYNPASIQGNVFTSGQLLDSGYVIAYQLDRSAYSLMNVAKVVDGGFSFDGNLLRGEYLFYAIPSFDIDTLFFPKYIATYNSGQHHWSDASTVFVDYNADAIIIDLIKYDEIYYGDFKINFSVSPEIIFNYDVANVLLINGKDEVINSIPLTSSNEVCFNNLPEGYYSVKVEIPGVFSKPAGFYLSNDYEPNIHFYFDDINSIDYTVTSIYEVDYADILVFPNPFSEYLSIQSNLFPAEVLIFNIQGVEVHHQTISENAQINLSGLSSGVYMAVVLSNKKTIARELIIKN
ncbi:MAG: T9SS type A sorting domain-containing protein [Bacteroidales bacterium]|nr:T9SS type A sorting domain-containing protein [Bacteroidales bacterium]